MFTFLWVTALYSINMFQTLSAFDCTTSDNGDVTLDLDPEINCYNDENHTIIIVFSTISLMLYTCVPMRYYYYHREKQMPGWVDPHNCRHYSDGKPCYDCDYCDYRQRYGWFYSKYHDGCFNYEFVVLIQKMIISGITLFFTTRKDVSLPMLIALNIFFIIVPIRVVY